MTKYEALEKNVVSSRKLPSLRQSLVRSVTQKVSVCWGFWGWSTELDSRLPWSMAEGEGFELAVRSFGAWDAVAIPNKQEAAHRAALSPGPANHIVGSRRPAVSQKTPFEKPF
jgi:hypothetical protein